MAETLDHHHVEHGEGERPKFNITIDGLRYSTRDDDQEAASLLRLAGLNRSKPV